MTTPEMADFIAAMPKAELHIHIEGVLEPAMKFEMAARNGLSLPYADVDAVVASYDFDDLPTFLDARYEGDTVLVTERDFFELAMAYYRRVADEHLIYAEIFFDPQAHTSRGVPFADVIAGLTRARDEAATTLGIESQLIMCFLRDHSAESAMATLEEAEPHRAEIVGVGLDSDEAGNPPEKFAAVFAAAAGQGYRLTMHCDVDQDHSVRNIWQAVDDIGVERIDHGVNALEDAALVAELARRGLGMTVCPISNRYVVADSRSHDLKRMLDADLAASVHSDDPAYFGGYMNANLACAQHDGDLSADEVIRLVRNAFTTSWAEPARREAHLDRLDDYLATAPRP
jgi:adenosine deaminase